MHIKSMTMNATKPFSGSKIILPRKTLLPIFQNPLRTSGVFASELLCIIISIFHIAVSINNDS